MSAFLQHPCKTKKKELQMDKLKRKELISEWKERHPEMGVVSVKCIATDEEFYDVSKDIRTWFNRHRFELNDNQHKNKRLQELWNLYGENSFELTTVMKLKYDQPDDVKSDDLKELLALCMQENPAAKKL